MKCSYWILVVCFVCLSCSRKSGENNATGKSIISGENKAETNAGNAKENVVSTPNTIVAEAPQAWVYTTIGDSRFKTFNEITNNRVISSKTVDEAGKLKWTDQFSYSQDSKNLVEMRRIKPDGSIFQVRYSYSEDGHQTRIVIGPDGKQIPEESQDSFLNQ